MLTNGFNNRYTVVFALLTPKVRGREHPGRSSGWTVAEWHDSEQGGVGARNEDAMGIFAKGISKHYKLGKIIGE